MDPTRWTTYYRSVEEIDNTGSRQQLVSREVETEQRIYGANFIQDAGVLLQLPQVCMTTGMALFHRFYHTKSLVEHNVQIMAIACLFLAAKVDECKRRFRSFINVYYHLLHPSEPPLSLTSQEYWDLRRDIVRAERILLREIGFDTAVEHPHKFILNYKPILQLSPDVLQHSWNFANDSLRSDVCLRFRTEVIACACVYMATRMAGVPMPENWWEIFDAPLEEIEEIVGVIFSLYTRPTRVEYRPLTAPQSLSS